jgi:hypothetical protein
LIRFTSTFFFFFPTKRKKKQAKKATVIRGMTRVGGAAMTVVHLAPINEFPLSQKKKKEKDFFLYTSRVRAVRGVARTRVFEGVPALERLLFSLSAVCTPRGCGPARALAPTALTTGSPEKETRILTESETICHKQRGCCGVVVVVWTHTCTTRGRDGGGIGVTLNSEREGRWR